MTSPIDDFRQRLLDVRRRIAVAAEASGRDPDSVTLVAVSKTFPAEIVRMAVEAGATELGENRVQEGVAKAREMAASGVRWHLIGPLQRNKAKVAIDTFSLIHTLDRASLADRLARLVAEQRPPGYRQQVLVEVNVGGEPQKAGVLPDVASELVRHAVALPELEVCGLMAIPPFLADAEASRPAFRSLAELRDRMQDEVGVVLPELSMGMSSDFEVAVAEGATLVRVGTAIFGRRG